MKCNHLAALLLVAAYLLMPPPDGVARDHFHINFSAPLAKWAEVRRFNSMAACESARQVYRQKPLGGLPTMLESRQEALAAMRVAKCVSANDPRLKATGLPDSVPAW
jgi:hypothetical protein